MLQVDKTTKQPNQFLWILTIGLCLLIGILIPQQILTDHLWARQFASFMANWNPHVAKISLIPINLEVNRFYYSFLWVYSILIFGPLYIYEWIMLFQSNKISLSLLRWDRFILFCVIYIFITLCFYYGMTDYSSFLNTKSKYFFAAYSHWLVRPLWSLSAVFVIWIMFLEIGLQFFYLTFLKNNLKKKLAG